MKNFGLLEMVIIGVIVLLLFGAKRIPEIGSSMGKGIREFKRSISGIDEAITGDDTNQARMGDGSSATGGTNTTRSSAEPKRLSQ